MHGCSLHQLKPVLYCQMETMRIGRRADRKHERTQCALSNLKTDPHSFSQLLGLVGLHGSEGNHSECGGNNVVMGELDRLRGESRDYTASMMLAGQPSLTADITSDSRAGNVGLISGSSTWLSEGTAVGAKYGASRL